MAKRINLNIIPVLLNFIMITKETLRGMLKPENPGWRTNITKVEPNQLTTRGYSQEDLIGNVSFPEMVYLLLKGELPSETQKKMLEAVLVSFCDHGVTPPSTQSARLMASAGSPVNVCIAGGVMAFGKNHAGAIELAMKMLQKGVELKRNYKKTTEEIRDEIMDYFSDRNMKIPGFGHRYHKADPRARKLVEVAEELGCYMEHTKLVMAIQEVLYKEKNIKMNIDGANAAILSDMGFNWRIGSGMFIIGRIPGLLAHVNEEITGEEPFRKIFDMGTL